MKTVLKIGTRQSKLALWQSLHVADRLKKSHPELEIELVKIVTKGDKVLDAPLAKIGGKGLFTKELERALLDGSIDIAVHSLKDLPTVLPAGLIIGAVTQRAETKDALVSEKYASLKALPFGAKVGTSSLRRRAQLLALRPDLNVVDVRGNVDTRLQKVSDGHLDALILAAAGLQRLGYEKKIKEILPYDLMLPAVGQGALAAECRAADEETLELLAALHDEKTALATAAERAFLALIGGGCQVPVGVHASLIGEKIILTALIASLDGKKAIKRKTEGAALCGKELAEKLAEEMLSAGGRDILRETGLL